MTDNLISHPRPRRVRDIASIAAVLIDVDGTLIDSNAAHAETWVLALREHGISCDIRSVRGLVGMGADKLLPAVAGVAANSRHGRALAHRKQALFAERLPYLQATPGARALIARLRNLNKDVVVATSAADDEMSVLLGQAGVADLIPLRASKDDAARSKPDPDIVQAALARAAVPAGSAVMIGDTPYDIEAARRAGIDSIALRCGGHWSDADLGGAIAILDDPTALLEAWD